MRRQHRAALAAAVVFLSLVTTTHAASERRAPSRFDDRVIHRAGGAVSVLPLPVESLSQTDTLRAPWAEFEARNGGGWDVYLDDRTGLPTLVSGRGIPWLAEAALPGATLDDLERLARKFLDENVALFGDWSAILELDRAASLRLGNDHWQLVFRQRVDGVRVENARLDLHVVRGRMV